MGLGVGDGREGVTQRTRGMAITSYTTTSTITHLLGLTKPLDSRELCGAVWYSRRIISPTSSPIISRLRRSVFRGGVGRGTVRLARRVGREDEGEFS